MNDSRFLSIRKGCYHILHVMKHPYFLATKKEDFSHKSHVMNDP